MLSLWLLGVLSVFSRTVKMKEFAFYLVTGLLLYHNQLGDFLAFLGRDPRALWFGNFIGVWQQIGKKVK